MPENNLDKEKNNLKTRVLGDLEKDEVTPLPKSLFIFQECLFWLLGLLASGIGAVAVAITLFVVTYQQYAFYEVTNENFLVFLLQVLPYLWLLLIFLMLFAWVFNFRHTKHGYRYSFSLVFGAGLLIAVLGGVFLHWLGVGFSLDKWFGNSVVIYESQEELQKNLWHEPQAGRLIGVITLVPDEKTEVVQFRDITKLPWEIVVTELSKSDWRELKSEQVVRVVGLVVDSKVNSFHACHVLPWFYDGSYERLELKKYRELISEKMENFEKTILPKLKDIKQSDFTEEKYENGRLCDTITPFGRPVIDYSY